MYRCHNTPHFTLHSFMFRSTRFLTIIWSLSGHVFIAPNGDSRGCVLHPPADPTRGHGGKRVRGWVQDTTPTRTSQQPCRKGQGLLVYPKVPKRGKRRPSLARRGKSLNSLLQTHATFSGMTR